MGECSVFGQFSSVAMENPVVFFFLLPSAKIVSSSAFTVLDRDGYQMHSFHPLLCGCYFQELAWPSSFFPSVPTCRGRRW